MSTHDQESSTPSTPSTGFTPTSDSAPSTQPAAGADSAPFPQASFSAATEPPAPARVRVHALAKELGTTSKAVLVELEALGDPRRSPSAILTPEIADQVRTRLAENAAAQAATTDTESATADDDAAAGAAATPPVALFVAPEQVATPPRRKSAAKKNATSDQPEDASGTGDTSDDSADSGPSEDSDATEGTDDADGSSRRRRRGRRGRGRKPEDDTTDSGSDGGQQDGSGHGGDKSNDKPNDKSNDKSNGKNGGGKSGSGDQNDKQAKSDDDQNGDEKGGSSRRRRRRRRRGDGGDSDNGGNSGGGNDEVRGVSGSVRLEAKRQRRREGRDAGRRRAPILTEAQFLARREAVTRRMIVRQRGERTQIAVLEDDVLVEHYVTLATEQSFAGSVFFGRVQNVLPSMEAAFVDIGKRRNAVLYAGEVNWDAAGLEGKQRSIEQAMKSGDKLLVQVTKDPIGHKGARLTSQISLPGRYLVYVPGGSMTGISRKLPEGERQRLKEILRRIVPSDAGVIIRTAAEGASEEELTRDVNRLKAQWEVIQEKAADTKTPAPSMLYEEPDLAIRVVRDLFNEDFASMEISGDDAWDTISAYIGHVAPDLAERVTKYDGDDAFEANRVDEQLAKALDRKVWLPSGGSLVIDHTEAMTVIDVNTGKFTGSGGNLEQTVTRNNLEAAEEIVRQLRLRDVGGIVVIDFIDMLLESNRELVLRRLTECLGRDRTKHQVAEVTSLGLVQMTRKRVGQGLLDAFSEPCPHCDGRGLLVHGEPVDKKTAPATSKQESSGRRRGRGKGGNGGHDGGNGSQGGHDHENDAPKRDSSAQLSAIAAASAKKAETTEQNERPPADQQQGQSTTATAVATVEAPEADRAAEERPKAAPRRRRAARRPAGPPSSSN